MERVRANGRTSRHCTTLTGSVHIESVEDWDALPDSGCTEVIGDLTMNLALKDHLVTVHEYTGAWAQARALRNGSSRRTAAVVTIEASDGSHRPRQSGRT